MTDMQSRTDNKFRKYYDYASAMLARKQHDEAIKNFKEAIRLIQDNENPFRERSFRLLGLAFYEKGELVFCLY